MTNNGANTANQKPSTTKSRHNIAMNETTRQRGEELATRERRSFSNLLEVLIDREYERQFPADKTAA